MQGMDTFARPISNANARQLFRFLIGLLIFIVLPVGAAPLRACASDVDYPPYMLTVTSGAAGGAQSTGLAINVLQRALRRMGREPALIERLPWLRCLKSVELGQVDIAVNVPSSQLNESRYWLTEPYAQVHSVYFYSIKLHPNGIDIRSPDDLKKFMVCGLIGNRLDAYGVETAHVDTGAKDDRAALAKVEAGRCDVFLEKREVVDSLSRHSAELRDLFASPNLVSRDFPDEHPSGLHLAISRSLPDGQALQQSFNATIRDLLANNEMERMTP